MKKTLFAIMIAASFSVSAGDLTVGASRNLSQDSNSVNVAYGTKLMLLDTQFGYARSDARGFKNEQLSAGISIPVAKLGTVLTSAKVAAVYLTSPGDSGYGLRYGVDVAMPVTKNFALVGSLSRLDTESKIHSFEGNSVGLAGRYSF